MEAPETVEMKQDEAEALIDRIQHRDLKEEDYALLEKLVRFSLWLQYVISEAKINIHKLRRLLGFRSERKGRCSSTAESSPDSASPSHEDSPASSGPPKSQGGKKKAKAVVLRRLIRVLRRS